MSAMYLKDYSNLVIRGLRKSCSNVLCHSEHVAWQLAATFNVGASSNATFFGRFTSRPGLKVRQSVWRTDSLCLRRIQGFSEVSIKFMPLLLLLCLIVGCAEKVVEIPLHREEMKNIRTAAILTPTSRPDISIHATTDDQFLVMLLSGPAIIPQIMAQLAMIDARKEDTRKFNLLTYDTHVGQMLRESLFSKLKRQAPFYVIPPEVVDDNLTVYTLQDKKDKTKEDYQTIAKKLGADTIIEVYVLSCGIKDPGVFAKPHTLLIAKVVVTRAREKKVIWQTKVGQAIPQESKFGFDYEKYEAEDAKLLKEELDTLASMLSEQIIESLGFNAQISTAKLLETPQP